MACLLHLAGSVGNVPQSRWLGDLEIGRTNPGSACEPMEQSYGRLVEAAHCLCAQCSVS